MINLSEAKIGDSVKVLDIVPSELRSKLLELGLVRGKDLSVLFHAPFGDPIAVAVDGFVLSLRKSEAALVQVALELK